jgi:hypothetical protein
MNETLVMLYIYVLSKTFPTVSFLIRFSVCDFFRSDFDPLTLLLIAAMCKILSRSGVSIGPEKRRKRKTRELTSQFPPRAARLLLQRFQPKITI